MLIDHDNPFSKVKLIFNSLSPSATTHQLSKNVQRSSYWKQHSRSQCHRLQNLAKVDENDQEIKSLEHGLGGSFKGVELNASYTRKYEFYERMKGLGYIVISPNQLFAFPSNNPHLSVFFKTRDGEKMLCKSVRVNPDKSVIVTKEGLKHTARGKVWIDSEGKDHKKR